MMSSLVLIGMRGAGKSTLGRVAADALGWEFLDMDQVLESAQGKPCGALVEELGWDGFRRVELEALCKVLADKPEKTVVSCGGGIVETEPARHMLQQYSGAVVHIEKDIDDTVDYLEGKEKAQQSTVTESESLARRPKYGESVSSVWERRHPWFIQCRTHHFFITKGDKDWQRVCREFEAMALAILTKPTPDIFAANCWIQIASRGVKPAKVGPDAMLLTECKSFQELTVQRRSVPGMPLVVDCGVDAEVACMALEHMVGGIRVESASQGRAIIEKRPRWFGTCQLVVDLHIAEPRGAGDALLDEVLLEALDHAHELPRLALGCVVLQSLAKSVPFVRLIARIHSLLPNVGIALGHGCGSESDRAVLMEAFGPTFFESSDDMQPNAKAPDHYCLFGHPIQLSPSPSMHNAGFCALGLRRRYTLCDTLDVELLRTVLSSHRFRGASVTIPHKEVVQPLLDELTPAAQAIGAVNTILRRSDGKLLGDNTDWFGIYSLIQAPLATRGGSRKRALVIGAGGTALSAAFCVRQLECELLVYNRTEARARSVSDRFSGRVVTSLDASVLGLIDVIISTVPATSLFVMPDSTWLSTVRPVVVDVAYRPRRTALLRQAAAAGCTTFEGIDMLVGQGVKQMEIWTDVPAQADTMDRAARQFYDRHVPQ